MRKTILVTVILILAVACFIGISYAAFTGVGKQNISNSLISECLKINFNEKTDAINLKNAIPISDEDGKKTSPYSFEFTNTCNKMITYTISLEIFEASTLNEDYVKITLADLNEPKLLGSFERNSEISQQGVKNSYIIESGTMGSNEVISRNLRMWMDYNTTKEQGANKTFSAKININIKPEVYTCQKAGIENFKDCLIATEFNAASSQIEETKQKITAKGTPDFSKTSPTLLYEITRASTEKKVIIDTITTDNIGTDYVFDENAGRFRIVNYTDMKYTDIDFESGKKYYSCAVGYVAQNGSYAKWTSCKEMYEISNTYSAVVDGVTHYYADGYKYTSNLVGNSYDNSGLYVTEDDYGTTYYYRGAVANNNVSFAGVNWKVVRINGDNSIKLIKTDSIGLRSYNLYNDKTAYFGYMYGNPDGSTLDEINENVNNSYAKIRIDDWYVNNLKKNYSHYLNDTIFCNDRSLYTGDGINPTSVYSAINRAIKYSPSLKCANKNDKFTVDDNINGNSALIYPIALLTSDELLFAGHAYEATNNKSWISSFNLLVTMSPAGFYPGNNNPNYCMLYNLSYGYPAVYNVNNQMNLFPVINLKSTVKVTGGTGTETNPYTITI